MTAVDDKPEPLPGPELRSIVWTKLVGARQPTAHVSTLPLAKFKELPRYATLKRQNIVGEYDVDLADYGMALRDLLASERYRPLS